MASKTVWIVGGLVVAIGVVAYVAFKPGPANTDTAGTIVEAKRARADGTNSVNPTPTASTTDQSASDASKGMAGPDAAKDAAGAAGGSGDNPSKRKLDNPSIIRQTAESAADTAAAVAGSQTKNLAINASASTRAVQDQAAVHRNAPQEAK
jgi:hypothetical protein